MVVFVNRFFHPDLAPTGMLAADLAFELAAHGYEVHVVTSRQRYDDAAAGLAPGETVRGVRIHRVWTTRFGRAGLVGRAFDYASYYLSATWRLWRLLRSADVAIAKTDPPLISVCVLLACRLRGATLVNWLEDVFPEVAQRVGMRWVSIAKSLRDMSVRGARANVVLGPRMEREVAGLVPGANLRVIPNWSDGATIRPLPRPPEGKFIVGYSGNFGRAHEAETVLRAIERLPDIEFRFTGGGHHFARLPDLPNVVRRDYVPAESLASTLAACNVHLVTLLPQLEGLIMPSKLYSAMAAGRPTLFVGDLDGEAAAILRQHRCGLSVAAGDARGLCDAILSLKDDAEECEAMGARARSAFLAHWDKPIALRKWRALIEELTALT